MTIVSGKTLEEIMLPSVLTWQRDAGEMIRD